MWRWQDRWPGHLGLNLHNHAASIHWNYSPVMTPPIVITAWVFSPTGVHKHDISWNLFTSDDSADSDDSLGWGFIIMLLALPLGRGRSVVVTSSLYNSTLTTRQRKNLNGRMFVLFFLICTLYSCILNFVLLHFTAMHWMFSRQSTHCKSLNGKKTNCEELGSYTVPLPTTTKHDEVDEVFSKCTLKNRKQLN